ncbi:DUF4395 family protein [Niallia sp. NCCP-28]|uniref:DUF4395 family protein n=1 Tax=Niallia sp. NCCP-28 TaxID=2934712 RepID=UPI0020C0EE3D|nr:DUF4395 family protein [Niallia sp. NCCP-28]
MSVLFALLAYKSILFLPSIIGVYTLITKKNPIILIWKRFLKKPLSRYVMEDKNQQLFNQWIATACLGLSIVFFQLRWNMLGCVFSVMVLLVAGIALAGFCIGCFIPYRYIMWKHKNVEK